MSARATPADLAEVIQRARPVLNADGHVRFAYVFGSTARGDAHPGSDVDAAGSEDVDLVTLNTAPLCCNTGSSGKVPSPSAVTSGRESRSEYLAATRERARRGMLSHR